MESLRLSWLNSYQVWVWEFLNVALALSLSIHRTQNGHLGQNTEGSLGAAGADSSHGVGASPATLSRPVHRSRYHNNFQGVL